MATNNKKQAISGFFWRFFERIGAQGVSFVVSVILARLLAPELFGAVALALVMTAILQVFVDSGLGTALIQKKDADDLDFSTVFYCNIATCVALYVATFLAAPTIARFFEKPELTPTVIRALCLTLLISGVRNVQQAYVSRKMLFRKFFFATLGGTLGSAAVGIGMAYAGFGIWALVGQQLFNAFVGVAILWATVDWRPKLLFSFERLKGLFSFGWKLLVAAVIDAIYFDLRHLVIGKLYTSADLAYYNRGSNLATLTITNVNTAIDSVLLPTMSQVQDDPARVKAMTRRAIKTCAYLIAPIMIGLAVCAEATVSLLLTDKWLPCAPYLRVFCCVFLFYPIHAANKNAIKALGRSDYFLKLEIAQKTVGLLFLVATMRISVMAMAYSLLATTIVWTIINARPNAKLLNYNWFEQMRDFLPNVALAAAMGAVVYFVGWIPLPTFATLALQVATGALVYVGLSAALKLEIFFYLLNTAKEMTRRKKAA